MCHTELALKNKCNSPGWRHVKLFQIYLQDSLAQICSHQRQAAKQSSMAAWMLQFGRSVVTAHSKFFTKNSVPSICSSKEVFSQIQTKTIISPFFRPLQRGRWCHRLSLWFLWQWMERNSNHFSVCPYLCPFLSPDYEGRLDELGLT